jgi:hypothetical protein
MNGTRLLEILKNNFSNEDIGNNEWDIDKLKSFKLESIEVIEEFGGQGLGNLCFIVYYVKDYNLYFKIEGFYSSYSGSEYENDPFIVTPVIKPVTFFETI